MVMLYITHLPNPAVVHGINWSPKTHLGTRGQNLGENLWTMKPLIKKWSTVAIKGKESLSHT